MFHGWVEDNYLQVKERAAQTVADVAGWGWEMGSKQSTCGLWLDNILQLWEVITAAIT